MKIYEVTCPSCESEYTIHRKSNYHEDGSSVIETCPFCSDPISESNFTMELTDEDLEDKS